MSVGKLFKQKVEHFKWNSYTMSEYMKCNQAVLSYGHVLSPGQDKKDPHSIRLIQFIARHGGHVVFCIRPDSTPYDQEYWASNQDAFFKKYLEKKGIVYNFD